MADPAPNEPTLQELMLRLEMQALQDRYVAAIDGDRLEDWPGFFTDDCLYEIVSRENEQAGLPAPVVHCDNIRMVRDRVTSCATPTSSSARPTATSCPGCRCGRSTVSMRSARATWW